jgi:hypothetical protein
MKTEFDEKICQQLKYYVYLLIDPKTDEPFYVGKGKDNRVFAHLNCALGTEDESNKYDEIRRIIEGGQSVKHVIVRHGLTENNAFEIECALIDTFKFIPKFNHFIRGNIQGGVKSIEKGLMTTEEIIRLYNAVTLKKIGEDCVIININKTYKRGAGENAIYNATKETWDIKEPRREKIKYVLSEYHGLIVEVFKVRDWYAKQRDYNPKAIKYGQTYTGWGFDDGEIAEPNIRDKYINKSIAELKPQGFSGVIIFPDTLEKWINN